jgi:hypothetical protein
MNTGPKAFGICKSHAAVASKWIVLYMALPSIMRSTMPRMLTIGRLQCRIVSVSV